MRLIGSTLIIRISARKNNVQSLQAYIKLRNLEYYFILFAQKLEWTRHETAVVFKNNNNRRIQTNFFFFFLIGKFLVLS